MRPIYLKVEPKDRIMVTTVEGQISLGEATNVFTKACDAAAERGLALILVDCLSVEGELSTMEGYELGRAVAAYCNSRSIAAKVATVGKAPLINGFAALVATNRGLVAETFSETQKAISWLKRFASRAAADKIG